MVCQDSAATGMLSLFHPNPTLCCTVVASEKGVVVGRLSFREDGDLINCQRMGVGGKAVPPNVDKARPGLLHCIILLGLTSAGPARQAHHRQEAMLRAVRGAPKGRDGDTRERCRLRA